MCCSVVFRFCSSLLVWEGLVLFVSLCVVFVSSVVVALSTSAFFCLLKFVSSKKINSILG